MKFRDILVHIDGSAGSHARLQMAALLAAAHRSHLIGLRVAEFAAPLVLSGVDPDIFPLMQEEWRHSTQAESQRLQAEFDDILSRNAVIGEWRVCEGDITATVTAHAKCADLAIVGLGRGDADCGAAGAVLETVLFNAGRPLLALPAAPTTESLDGKHILIGWDGSRAAVRAVHDALPLLERAGSVTVLTIGDTGSQSNDSDDAPATDLVPHLARHGIEVIAVHLPNTGASPADGLLRYAAAQDCRMIVAGGYGHSFTREYIFGGVTRRLVAETTLPLFLSH